MPTYTYVCEGCGYIQHNIRPMAERHNYPDCPKCGGDTHLSLNSLNWERGSGWASRMDGAPKPGTVDRK